MADKTNILLFPSLAILLKTWIKKGLAKKCLELEKHRERKKNQVTRCCYLLMTRCCCLLTVSSNKGSCLR